MQHDATFGRVLKRRRQILDLTQEALAARAHCAAETIRKLEAGGRRPSKPMAHALAEALELAGHERAEFLHLARPQPEPEAGTPPKHPVPATVNEAGGPQPFRGGAAQPIPIVATKLYVPRPRAALVARPRLLARLDAGLAGRLTVIAAPAGFGKTTLLAEWLSRIASSDSAPASAVAWLALDRRDSDPIQFLRYLIAALQTIVPTVGITAARLLVPGQAPPLETLMSLLINDLVELPDRSILVLDDYYVVDAPAVHQALAFLLDHLPPQLHLVVASRVDPPLPSARLRARGQLTELRAADLRFTPEEAATFLQEVMDLPLRTEDVAALEARTEGWIAGLQLAALAMRDHDDHRSFVRAFAGSNRFVVDYLIEEVVERLPAHLQTFVLQTSVLDRLCGPLCDAVLGITDPSDHTPSRAEHAYSQVLLAEIERANLFLVPLDDERRWYRYHHLFGEVLRAQLQHGTPAEHIAMLHERASAWYERAGLGADAIQHALAGRHWERATRLLIEITPTMANRSQFHTVLAWVNALPETIRSTHPTLCVYQAGLMMYINKVDAAEARLEDAERALAASPPGTYSDDEARVIRGHAAVIGGGIKRIRGDLAGCIALSRRGLELLPEVETTPLRLRAVAGLNASRAFQVTGDVTPATEQVVTSMVARVREAGNWFSLLTAIVNLARLHVLAGRLRQAAATYSEATCLRDETGELHAAVGGTAYYFGIGDLQREWNDLTAAEGNLQRGMALLEGALTVDADVVAQGYVAMARLQQARGAHAEALQTLRSFLDFARSRSFAAAPMARVAAVQAQLALAQGDLAAATRWADATGLRWDDELDYVREAEHLTFARVLIAQGRHGCAPDAVRDASRLLDRLLESAEAGARIGSVIEILILRSLTLHLQGNSGPAMSTLERALMFAAPEGYIRIFVDEGPPMAELLRTAPGGRVASYVASLLAAFGECQPMPGRGSPYSPPAQVEPLTAREHEVLRLLAMGRSNQAIAEELVVALGTVKRHVNSIFGKLHVESRLEAVARARELDLV